jgi:hypothetical protein
MTTLETREKTPPHAGEGLKGRVALGRGAHCGVGIVIGRSLASRLGRRDGVARVADFLCADACAVISGRVWAVTGGREM